jgi:glycogenin glucosyltransferase
MGVASRLPRPAAASVPTSSGELDSRGYVTVLGSDDYLNGVLVLNESLRMCRSKYRLYVVVGSNVSPAVHDVLAKARIATINLQSPDIPDEIVRANQTSDYHRHWAGVFDKLHVFSLCQFDKLVYIDSDILVMKNIDHLFEKPHMSGVIADRYPGNEDCVDLNAGLMVIEPEADLTNRLIALVPKAFEHEKEWRSAAGRPPSMGVQGVINMFWNEWIARDELHLDEKYNVLAEHLDYYVRRQNYRWRGPNGIHVLHFVGAAKPWMTTRLRFFRRIGGLLARRRVWEPAALIAYVAVLGSARLQLRKTRLS